MLEDIAILTGGTAIFESLGTRLEKLELAELGRARKVIVEKDATTIIEGGGTTADIKGRIAQIEQEYEKATSDYDREKLQERKAKLAGGVAKISVGGATESEVKEKKLRFEDALSATRAAVEEGILAGGGVALIRAASACQPQGLNQDEQTGYKIVQRACRSPLTWIAENAGKDGSLVCEKVLEGKGNFGYNAVEDAYQDLVKSGVIDPTKVVRIALQNAASVATLLLTSDALIAERPKDDKKSLGRGGDYGMY
jgi:chaperonin GroEL